jgi:hypothetical protein
VNRFLFISVIRVDQWEAFVFFWFWFSLSPAYLRAIPPANQLRISSSLFYLGTLEIGHLQMARVAGISGSNADRDMANFR